MLRHLLLTVALFLMLTQGSGLECLKCEHTPSQPNEPCIEGGGVPIVYCDGECFLRTYQYGNSSSTTVQRGCTLDDENSWGYGCQHARHCTSSFRTCKEDYCNQNVFACFIKLALALCCTRGGGGNGKRSISSFGKCQCPLGQYCGKCSSYGGTIPDMVLKAKHRNTGDAQPTSNEDGCCLQCSDQSDDCSRITVSYLLIAVMVILAIQPSPQ